MRRQNIHLIALVRQGDRIARREVGKHYLLGTEGFPRHVRTGINYLTHSSLHGSAEAAHIISESLPLEDIAAFGLSEELERAARTGSVSAAVKYAVWRLINGRPDSDVSRYLSVGAKGGHLGAKRAVRLSHAGRKPSLHALLAAFDTGPDMNVGEVAVLAARSALLASDVDRLLQALDAALRLRPKDSDPLDDLVVQAMQLAESSQRSVAPLTAQFIEPSLDRRAHQGDASAAYTLGRALCGIQCGAIAPNAVVGATALRRGTALLFRAADKGCGGAWMHLYRLHADQRLSVANSQMARFCLEKASLLGVRQAQTKLGALLLRAARSLDDSEQAISWLHKASTQGDVHARELLSSLRLELAGSESEARTAIEHVRRHHPWLAMRMQIARDFGLTKLEALCVDPVEGLRPWGLVVGRNPYVVQSRLSAPRAIPAPSPQAQENLHRIATTFAELGRDGDAVEGDARRRSLVQRRTFVRLGIDEAMFFAKAAANTLDTLRQGARWAFRAKEQLRLALGA